MYTRKHSEPSVGCKEHDSSNRRDGDGLEPWTNRVRFVRNAAPATFSRHLSWLPMGVDMYAEARSVLLVDDDENDAFLIRRGLLRVDRKLNVEISTTYPDALREVESGRYDAALVDYRLGASSGLDLIESCRAKGCSTPMILLTGMEGPDIDNDAVRRGAADYLSKNEMTPQMLERSIRYAIERSAAAEVLRTEKRRYEAAVAGSNDGIWDWDIKSTELYLSPRFKEMLGFADDELQSTRTAWFDRVHPEDREALESALREHTAGRTPTLTVEYRMQHRDGRWRWMFLRGMLQRDPGGRGVRLAGSQSDITERKHAQEEERLLLAQTLTGAVTVLSEVIGLTTPCAFSRADAHKRYVQHMCRGLGIDDMWAYEIAAALSQLGCITLPPETLERVYAGQPLSDKEQSLVDGHPDVGGRLLERIPRLDAVASMIRDQHRTSKSRTGKIDPASEDASELGARMLAVAIAFDREIVAGHSPSRAVDNLRARRHRLDRGLLELLRDVPIEGGAEAVRVLPLAELRSSMVFDEDVVSLSGNTIVPRGRTISCALLEKLRNFAVGSGIVEPIRVRVPT